MIGSAHGRISLVPSLAELVADPDCIATLSPVLVAGLVVQLAALQQQLGARLAAAGPVGVEAPAATEPDRLLPAPDAAALLGISPLTLLRKRQRLPYRDFVVPTGTRRPRFSQRRIQDYITLHAGTASAPRRVTPMLTGR